MNEIFCDKIFVIATIFRDYRHVYGVAPPTLVAPTWHMHSQTAEEVGHDF